VTSPLEQALDLAVWGPLGVALAIKDAAPEWIEQGRVRAGEQFANAKALGELATDYGHKLVAAKLVGLGILPGPPPPGRPAGASVSVAEETPSANGHGTEPPARFLQPPAGPAPEPSDLAIPGYDSLSASQVVSRLGGLAPGELEAVRAYEAASRGRRTILTKISQLQE
jgi:hypothetical protein